MDDCIYFMLCCTLFWIIVLMLNYDVFILDDCTVNYAQHNLN